MTAEDRKAQACFTIGAADLVSLAAHCDTEGQATIGRWLTAMDLRERALEEKSDATPAQLRYLAGLTGHKREYWEWAVCIPFEDCKSLLDSLLEDGHADYRGVTYTVTVKARKSNDRKARKDGVITAGIPW